MKDLQSRAFLPLNRRGFLLSSLAFGGAAALSGWAGRALAADDGILRARLYNDINRLDPAIYDNLYNVDVMGVIYPKLIGYKPNSGNWDWQLEAAESIEQIDETHIRFKLKQGLRFSGDFGEITADDVKFSFERVIDPTIKSPVAGDWGPLQGVDVEDSRTGVIVLKEPYAALWTVALPFGVGHIVSKQAVEAAGPGTFAMDPPKAFGGPYKLKEWRANEVTILERNEAWTGAEPAFQEIRLFPIADEQAGEIAFEAGDVDVTQVSAASLQRFKDNPPADSTVEDYPALVYRWMGLNAEHPKLADKRVRQAIQYAVNVQLIVEAAFFGVAPVANGILAPGVIGHRETTIVPPEGDAEKARQLLAEAGVSDLELTLTIANTGVNSTMAQIIQANLQDVGIACNIIVLDSAAFWTVGMESEGEQWKDLQLYLTRFTSLPDPYYAMQWFTTDQVGIWNWQRWSDPELDELAMQANRITDPGERAKMYRRMQDLMEESGAYRFITHEVNAIVYRNHLKPALRPDGVALYSHFERV